MDRRDTGSKSVTFEEMFEHCMRRRAPRGPPGRLVTIPGAGPGSPPFQLGSGIRLGVYQPLSTRNGAEAISADSY